MTNTKKQVFSFQLMIETLMMNSHLLVGWLGSSNRLARPAFCCFCFFLSEDRGLKKERKQARGDIIYLLFRVMILLMDL